MNITQLKYFAVVADVLSFTKAAHNLYVAQPNLSKNIASLEKELGFPLFYRGKRQLELTKEGQLLFERLRGIPKLVEDAINEASAISRMETKTLSVGIMQDHEVIRLIEDKYRQLLKSHPDFDFRFEIFGNYEVLRKGLRINRFDAIIVPSIEIEKSSNYFSKVILEQDICITLNKNLPIAKKENLTIQDLKNETFLILSSSEANEDSITQMTSFLKSLGIESPRFNHLDSMDNLLLNVELGKGIALLGQHSYLENNPKIRFIKINDSKINIMINWSNDNTNPMLSVFVNAICARS